MILLTGANGVVGYSLQTMLEAGGYLAVSRTAGQQGLQWDLESESNIDLPALTKLIHCAPIWLLPAHLQLLYDAGVRQFIVFSSTSVVSKTASKNHAEQQLVKRLSDAEQAIKQFCSRLEVSLTILRPSLIYGYGRDQNISHIASFINKFGFAVVAGKARGLRQPVHADDLAKVCISLIENPQPRHRTYTLAGADVITYRTMVEVIFSKLNKRSVIIGIPLWCLRLALSLASKVGRFDYTADMADRMQQNLVYDNQAAIDELNYQPSAFLDQPQRDLPDYVG